ncbi:helix-turn-helix domain-containing protein [Vibrio ziniensis]|uniref:Helix-turn-helix domain-containing protein n=1 Tax=Vibrio ziniensis TaxID=2711221 RepID=A0A6G7CLT1_9VIBR|nr:helix-turn-helix domain-containing protein [Vibrio ziniensis]QIH43091.1 helix-turn-helix domain-containing protein [Vibrio ziniensis]
MFQLSGEEFFKHTDSAVCTETRAPQPDYPEHSHDFHELIIVTKGAGQHILNDSPTNLAQNYICYITPGDRHMYEQVENLHLTNILFKKNRLSYSPILKNFLPNESSDSKSWFITNQTMSKVEQILQQLDHESRSNTVESRLMMEVLFQHLVVEISRGRLTSQSNDVNDNIILKVIDWLQRNYSEEVCINEISDKFKISSRSLSRKIKQVTNLSFNNYVHRVRINNAMDLLQSTDKSITDIAFEVGYKDSNYFSTKFKRFTKKTPSQYR